MGAKFVITKWEDLLELDSEDIDKFQEIQRKIEKNRKAKGKNPNNKYLVINVDEPYINEVAEVMIENGHDVREFLK